MTNYPVERTPRSPRSLELRPVTITERPEVESFIRQRFAETYGARVESFLPDLHALADSNGQLVAALGLRAAARESLFLEQYMDVPIEQALALVSGRPVARHQVVEIGNLAGRSPGALRQLLPRMGEFLRQTGYRWLTFTGNAQLINSFERSGISLLGLAAARPERLDPAARAAWGSYYEHSPMVMGCDIHTGRMQLNAHLSRLWTQA